MIGEAGLGVRVGIDYGAMDCGASSDIAFQAAARGAFKDAYNKAHPVILEPIMKVTIEGPNEFQGAYIRTIMQRRGMIAGTVEEDGFTRVDSEVPLSEMFGYATDLRSCSQGKAEFTMEFSRYTQVPRELQEELIEKHEEESKG